MVNWEQEINKARNIDNPPKINPGKGRRRLDLIDTESLLEGIRTSYWKAGEINFQATVNPAQHPNTLVYSYSHTLTEKHLCTWQYIDMVRQHRGDEYYDSIPVPRRKTEEVGNKLIVSFDEYWEKDSNEWNFVGSRYWVYETCIDIFTSEELAKWGKEHTYYNPTDAKVWLHQRHPIETIFILNRQFIEGGIELMTLLRRGVTLTDVVRQELAMGIYRRSDRGIEVGILRERDTRNMREYINPHYMPE